jgi:hypothetical protein
MRSGHVREKRQGTLGNRAATMSDMSLRTATASVCSQVQQRCRAQQQGMGPWPPLSPHSSEDSSDTSLFTRGQQAHKWGAKARIISAHRLSHTHARRKTTSTRRHGGREGGLTWVAHMTLRHGENVFGIMEDHISNVFVVLPRQQEKQVRSALPSIPLRPWSKIASNVSRWQCQ